MKFNFTKKIGIAAASAAFSLTMFSSTAFADTTLVLSSWLPRTHPIVAGAIEPWADQVEEATEGRVTIRILAKPAGSPPAHYDMAAEGVADITYGLHSFTTDDRFTRSRIGQFSFLANDAVAGSIAFWNVYGGQLNAQAEHEGTKLLGLFVHGPGTFHNTVREIETVGDFSGLKVRVPGGYVSDLIAGMGGTTLFMSTGEVFEKLTRGVIDGVMFPFDALAAFSLSPHVKHTMTIPGGLYNTSWFLVANEERWNEISAQDQAAIEAISGAAFSALVGAAWDAADADGKAAAQEDNVNVYDAPAAVLDAIKTFAANSEAAWIDEIAATGFDGSAALEAFRAETGVEY